MFEYQVWLTISTETTKRVSFIYKTDQEIEEVRETICAQPVEEICCVYNETEKSKSSLDCLIPINYTSNDPT